MNIDGEVWSMILIPLESHKTYSVIIQGMETFSLTYLFIGPKEILQVQLLAGLLHSKTVVRERFLERKTNPGEVLHQSLMMGRHLRL